MERNETRLRNLEELSAYIEGGSLPSQNKNGVTERTKETTQRSALKSMMWRIIAGGVTLISSLKFSGSMRTALTIVGSDFFSKSLTMFIGERMMNKSQGGRTGDGDGVGRSIAKALIWRVFALFNTLVACIFISKDWSMASKIASSDAVIKTLMMFVYERAWAKVEWGKEYEIEFQI
jgi:uncharacterized membrane protein